MKTILIQPNITEKSMRHAASGIFTFEVAPHVTKTQVKDLVATLFKVRVVGVTISSRVSPIRRTGSRRLRSQAAPKRFASVKLDKGQSIELFDLKESK